MSQMSMGKRVPVGKPPDKGSFPLDHFNECSTLKEEYLLCLKEHSHDNMSCRYLSKQYLECRMDRNLMAKEPMHKLGFVEGDSAPKPPRRRGREATKEESGWSVGVDNIKPDRSGFWRKATLLSLFRSHDSGD